MRLAVSNIAWDIDEEDLIARQLADEGITAVEIAPTKVFSDPTNATADEVAAYRSFWSSFGIEIVAFQSILFGHPDMRLFRTQDERIAFIAVARQFIDLADMIGARRIVFGSPVQRAVPSGMSSGEASRIAQEIFTTIGEIAAAKQVVFCIEPNPSVYGCNFVTTASAGDQLVREVASEGFGLHLDAAGMALAHDNPATAVAHSHDLIRHFHLSAPQLGELDPSLVDYSASLHALESHRYSGAVSIEMRSAARGTNLRRVSAAILTTRRAANAAGVHL